MNNNELNIRKKNNWNFVLDNFTMSRRFFFHILSATLLFLHYIYRYMYVVPIGK